MKYPLDIQVKIVREKILNGSSVLLFGNSENTSKVLKKTYEELSEDNKFLCSCHHASLINSPLDFYTPILKLRFGKDYESKLKYFFEMQSKHPDKIRIFELTDYCGQDLQGKTENERKLPIIFVEGFEKLLFKLDFPKLLKEEYKGALVPYSEGGIKSLGFGDSLRHLQQAIPPKISICGTVKDHEGIECKTTLANRGYLFYSGNFTTIEIK